MLIFTPFYFHLCWMLTMDIMPFTGGATTIQLNMAEESVDDMYDGCRDSMKTILDTHFSKEKKGLWTISNSCANEKLAERSPEDKALTKENLQAICMYTGSGYNEINKAVREQKNTYGGSFKYHILHFYLTTALQILNPNKKCLVTYRRTPDKYEGQVGEVMRFGSFTSSSKDSHLTRFGKETCFQIQTCLGADLKHYPLRGEDESEVLIPPYETFTIKEKISNGKGPEGLKECKLVFVLDHLGDKSNLNCKLIKLFSSPSKAHG